MKKGMLFFVALLLMFTAIDVFAQGCPMCKTALEEARQNGSQVGNTLNNGILYLLALPYLIVGTFAVIWFKNQRSKKKQQHFLLTLTLSTTNQYIANKGLAMLQCKCPRCQSGNMFKYRSTRLTRFMEMNEFCPHCQLRFEIEPGFFWGAMYVSYAITTGLMLVTCGILVVGFNDPDFWVYVTSIIVVVLGSLPWVFRYSRLLMLYIFSPIRFDKQFANK